MDHDGLIYLAGPDGLWAYCTEHATWTLVTRW